MISAPDWKCQKTLQDTKSLSKWVDAKMYPSLYSLERLTRYTDYYIARIKELM